MRRKLALIRQLKNNPQDTEAVQGIAEMVANLEADQIDAVETLANEAALGYGFRFDREERRNEILELAQALADGTLAEWYASEFLDLDNPDSAERYADLEPEQWLASMNRWAKDYRQEVPDQVEGLTDAQIADLHVQSVFNVDLATFSKRVVRFSKSEALEHVLLGNLIQMESVIRDVADVIDVET